MSLTSTAPTRLAWMLAIPALVIAGFVVPACGDDSQPADTSSDEAPVTREILGQVPSTEAGGYDLHFQRVTIAPGVELPEHFHPGIEVARIEQGELTYHVVEGTAAVARDHAGEPTEQVEAPAVITLRPGDTVYEMDDMEHFAENKGDEPVVLILTALIEGGEPLTVEVEN